MSELNRKIFIKFLASCSSLTFKANLPIGHADREKLIDEQLKKEPLTIKVSGKQMCVLNYFKKEGEHKLLTRYEAYEFNFDKINTKESLIEELETQDIMYLEDVVYDFRNEQNEDDETKDLTDSEFIQSLSEEKFQELLLDVDSHLNDEISEEEELPYNYSRTSLDGYDVAYRMFDDVVGDAKELKDLLGIEIVYGESIASTYYAAELRKPLEEANEIAKKINIPITFVR